MRQIFTSQRLENVDKVEALMHEAGIETYVSGRDKLRRDRRRRFSYTERGQAGEWPAVWVVKSDDLIKAREIMRSTGLMGSTRPDPAVDLPMPNYQRVDETAGRFRRVLLVAAVLSAAILVFFYSRAKAPAPAPMKPVASPVIDPMAPISNVPPDPTVVVIEDPIVTVPAEPAEAVEAER